MNANVTINDILSHTSLKDFFFRKQASDTLDELLQRSALCNADTIDALDEIADDMSIDDVEELLYAESVEWLARFFNIELEEN